MKWSPKKEPKNKCLKDLAFKKHLLNSKFKAALLLVCLSGVGTLLAGDIPRIKDKILASVSPHTHSTKVNQVATEITIKILGKDFLGSGFLLKKEDQKYIVITNQHVLRAGEAPYSIQAPDGETYPAKVLAHLDSTEYDLAILEFEANNSYEVATVGNSLYLGVGEPIFAAGFSYEAVKSASSTSSRMPEISTGFAFKRGRIVIILDKALEEGYQIGYTNDVKKGMSGGPLLNNRGEVVGVNGKHAYPLWEAPDFYQDGSQPCAPLQELISRSSLAIPIEKGIGLTPNLNSLKPETDIITSQEKNSLGILDSDTLNDSPDLIEQMKQEAEATKNCQSSEQKPVIDL